MRSPMSRRAAAVAGVVAMLSLSTPVHAAERPAATTPAADVCTVTDATLTWGFKESFRSYISGSIAHGEWEPIDGATYETPVFTWTGGTGTVAPDGSAGTVTFPGGVHFTGHDGLLDTTIANPTIVLGADPQLLLDVTGVSMESALAGDGAEAESVLQVPFVAIDASGIQTTADDDAVAVVADGAASAITDAGFAAFGSYAAGTAFDPVSFSLTADCPVETPTPTPTVFESATPLAEAPTDADGAAPPGLYVGLGAAAAALVGVGVYLFGRRRSRGAPTDGDTGS